MIKELKFFLYISVILTFIFLTLKFYFSDINKKNSYRSLNLIDKKIINFSKQLKLLNNDTDDIVEYVKKNDNNNKKNYNFWKLLGENNQ
jgi:cell shape-determining protein MreC